MTNPVFWLVPVSAVLALLLAWYFYREMLKQSEGTDTMKRIASHVRKGAMSYLKQQYKIVGLVFLCLVVLFSVMAYGFQSSESVVRRIPHRRLFLGPLRLPGHEDRHIYLGPNSQRRPAARSTQACA